MQSNPKSSMWEPGVKFNLKVDSIPMNPRNPKKQNITSFSSNILFEGKPISSMDFFHMVISPSQPRLQFISVFFGGL